MESAQVAGRGLSVLIHLGVLKQATEKGLREVEDEFLEVLWRLKNIVKNLDQRNILAVNEAADTAAARSVRLEREEVVAAHPVQARVDEADQVEHRNERNIVVGHFHVLVKTFVGIPRGLRAGGVLVGNEQLLLLLALNDLEHLVK